MKAKVTAQNICIMDSNLVSKTEQVYVAQFIFSDEWDEYTKVAVFKMKDGEAWEVILTNDSCLIPTEVLVKAGLIQVGVYGINGTKVYPTIWSDYLYVLPGTTEGQEPLAPTPSQYAQIIAIMEAVNNAIPDGGLTGYVLAKASDEDRDTEWIEIDLSQFITDAPSDGKQYARQDGSWTRVTGGGTGDYEELENKPSINGVELVGNKTLAQLGIVIPTLISELTNDTGYVTNSVSNLINYYLKSETYAKSETYTKQEVQTLIDAVKQFEYVVVSVLPTASADTMHKIYLVPASESHQQNVKDEYITLESSGVYSWEQIGSTEIDLSNYYTKDETDFAIEEWHDPSKAEIVIVKFTQSGSHVTADKTYDELVQALADGKYVIGRVMMSASYYVEVGLSFKYQGQLIWGGFTEMMGSKLLVSVKMDSNDNVTFSQVIPADSATLEDHVDDDTIHVTEEDKEVWDAKADGSDIASAISTHNDSADAHSTMFDSKVDKPDEVTAGNVAIFNSNGNIADCGKKGSDLLTKPSSTTENHVAQWDAQGNLKDGMGTTAVGGIPVTNTINGQNPSKQIVPSEEAITKWHGKDYELIEKIIVGYSALASQPADWTTNWTDYYENTGTAVEPVYTQLSSASAPTFVSGKYFSYSEDGAYSVKRNLSPDGKAYDYIGIIVNFEFQSGDTSALYINTYNDSSSEISITFISQYGIGGAITTSKQYMSMSTYNRNGIWESYCSGHLTGPLTTITQNTHPRKRVVGEGESIKALKAYASANLVIPSGSIIEILGLTA